MSPFLPVSSGSVVPDGDGFALQTHTSFIMTMIVREMGKAGNQWRGEL